MFLNAWAPARRQGRSLSFAGVRMHQPSGSTDTLLRSTPSHVPQENLRDGHIKPSNMGVFNFASDLLFVEEATFQGREKYSG